MKSYKFYAFNTTYCRTVNIKAKWNFCIIVACVGIVAVQEIQSKSDCPYRTYSQSLDTLLCVITSAELALSNVILLPVNCLFVCHFAT